MKIVVVGGAGYIGSTLVQRLVQTPSLDVTVIDNLFFKTHSLHSWLSYPNFHFIKGDIRDLGVSDMHGADYVVNLAGLTLPLSKRYPELAMEVNHRAAVRLARLCKEVGSKYIFSSTCSNYGIMENGYAMEDDELYPTSVYAKSKVETEKALMHMSDGPDYVIFRFATAYGLGARFRPDLILHEFIKDALLKKRITLFGADFYRPLCHVIDIARAIEMAIVTEEVFGSRNSDRVYNIGNTKHNWTKLALAQMVHIQTACAIDLSSAVPDPRNYKVSFERAKSKLGFYTIREPAAEVGKIVNGYRTGAIDFEELSYNEPESKAKENRAEPAVMG